VRYGAHNEAPAIEGQAFVRGEPGRPMSVDEFLGTWVVVALRPRRADVLEFAKLEEAFAASGAVVVAATPDDWYSVEDTYADEPVRFPILADVDELRRMTLVVDPEGIVRHVGVRRSAHETLATFESLLCSPAGFAQVA
jgi:peroxiredoxin